MSRPDAAEMAAPALATILRGEDLVLRDGAAPFSLTVRPGEIVGLAGLEGQGQQELLWALCGLRRPRSGAVTVQTATEGKRRQVTSLQSAARAGVAYLPRDRKRQGILATMSVLDNFALPTMRVDTRFGFVKRRTQRRRYMRYAEQTKVKAASPRAAMTSLSGGNQQKVLLARWLAASPLVLLLDDPTRGVDIGTKRTLYEVFHATADAGTAIVLLSTEIEEIVAVCSRVVIFRDGSAFAHLDASQLGYGAIIDAMFGRIQ
jgi:ribose transport system ATP-binding protein